MGLGLVTAVHGYAAAYSYGGAMLIATVCTLVGVVLLVFGWTRAAGRRLLGATMLFLVGFGGLWGTVELLHLVRWRQAHTRLTIPAGR
jgi:hypothetical protein